MLVVDGKRDVLVTGLQFDWLMEISPTGRELLGSNVPRLIYFLSLSLNSGICSWRKYVAMQATAYAQIERLTLFAESSQAARCTQYPST